MGLAVVDQAEFRGFNSADGSWPIVFRSDTRPYSEIFGMGFQPRADASAKHLGTSTLTAPAAVALQLGIMDVDKETAVCVSLLPEMTVLFPFDATKNFGEEDVKVYICLDGQQSRRAPVGARQREGIRDPRQAEGTRARVPGGKGIRISRRPDCIRVRSVDDQRPEGQHPDEPG
jgi:hypothetical protein